MLNKEKTY